MKRANHDLSHYRLLTGDMGFLYPVGLLEVLPGDTFRHSARCLLRVQPMLKPVMHPVQVRIHHWYVPNRIVWDGWDGFITGRDSGDIPTQTYDSSGGGDFTDYSLIDHLGVPDVDGLEINDLAIRAYNAIWNHAYRDQDLQTEVDLSDPALKRVAWQKDYFTTCRANPQQGSSVTIPFQTGTKAPVRPENDSGDLSGYLYGQAAGPAPTAIDDWDISSNTGESSSTSVSAGPGGFTDNDYYQMFADLSSQTGGGIDVNDFREAMAFQRYLEARNRYGSRYEDYLRYLGIRPDDARLQDPEYLGGGKNVISMSEVLAQAASTGVNVGDLYGHGISAVSTRQYRRFFQEHGYVISLLSIRPRTIYTQMLGRHWIRRNKYDYWQKELEAMGPQEVYQQEIYAAHTPTTDILGYNGRHDEYRHQLSYVSGEYREGGDELDWHYGRVFSAVPALNSSLVECAPTDRVYADTATPEVYLNVSHNVRANRLVSKRARH